MAGEAGSSGRKRGATNPYTPARIDQLRRQNQAYRLMIAGVTSFQKIAETPDPDRVRQQLYSDGSAARKACLAAIQRHTGFREAQIEREIALQQIDVMMRGLYVLAAKGDPTATREYRAYHAERRKITGIDAPVKVRQETITVDAVDAAIMQLNDEHDQLAASLGDDALDELDAADVSAGLAPTGMSPAERDQLIALGWDPNAGSEDV